MEMQIAGLSMSMVINTQNAVSIAMMRKTMDSQEQAMNLITEMIGDMPSPDGRGQLMDVRV